MHRDGARADDEVVDRKLDALGCELVVEFATERVESVHPRGHGYLVVGDGCFGFNEPLRDDFAHGVERDAA